MQYMFSRHNMCVCVCELTNHPPISTNDFPKSHSLKPWFNANPGDDDHILWCCPHDWCILYNSMMMSFSKKNLTQIHTYTLPPIIMLFLRKMGVSQKLVTLNDSYFPLQWLWEKGSSPPPSDKIWHVWIVFFWRTLSKTLIPRLRWWGYLCFSPQTSQQLLSWPHDRGQSDTKS